MAAAKKAPKTKAKPKSKSSPAVYTNPALRDRLKAKILAGEKGGKPGRWSARKSQLLAAEYKKAGGGYKKGSKQKTGAQKDLDQWTGENWTTADGAPAVRDGETARYLPENAWDELTPARKKATDAKKKAASRKGKPFAANTGAAKAAAKK